MEDRQKKVQKVIAERKKKVEKQKKNITGMVMISIIVFAIIFILLCQKKNVDDRIIFYSEKYDTLQQALDEEKKHKKEIDKEAEYYKSDEYIAEIAREKLGILKDTEIIFSEDKYWFFLLPMLIILNLTYFREEFSCPLQAVR